MATVIDLPKDRLNRIKLADWLELNALLDSDHSSSIEDLSSQLKIAYGEREDEMERLCNDVSGELLSRQEKIQNCYPFAYNGKLLSVKNHRTYQNQWTYLFCLFISYIGIEKGSRELNIWKLSKTSSLFESISTIVARNFLSTKIVDAESLQFGAPRTSWQLEYRPFRKALAVLKSKIGEGDVKGNPTNSMRKDAGLDVIAWRSFPDNKNNKLFLLGQCAAGVDFINKKRGLLDFFSYYSLEVGVVNAFFIPHEVEDNDWILLQYREIGIVFDRSRIAFYAREWDGEEFKQKVPTILNKLRSYRKAL